MKEFWPFLTVEPGLEDLPPPTIGLQDVLADGRVNGRSDEILESWESWEYESR